VLVIRNDDSIIGGESLLLDSYPIVEELRKNYPEQFNTLTRIPATFQKIHYKRLVTSIGTVVHCGHSHRESPVHIVSQVPHIVLGEDEEVRPYY